MWVRPCIHRRISLLYDIEPLAKKGLYAKMSRPTVLIVGTLDTKRDETLFLRSQILSYGTCEVKILDVGRKLQDANTLQIPPDELVPRLLRMADSPEDLPRGEMINATIHRCVPVVHQLVSSGSIQGIVSAGGSSGSSLATALMRKACPVGFPKLMVSTMASGDIKHYVEETDITMMHSVVDIAGLNSILRRILSNAAGAITGMVMAYTNSLKDDDTGTSPLTTGKRIAITMFGVTTPCVDAIRRILTSAPHDSARYEIYVFHATGAGGLAVERLIREGQIDAVVDLTTTEVCDHLYGGVLSAGPERLEAGAKKGLPMIVSVGACDMVNFGPRATVPEKNRDRKLFEHNPAVTLMRTSDEECEGIGRFIAGKLKSNAIKPELVKVLLPEGGVSMIDKPGQAFHDSNADKVLFDVLEEELKDTKIAVERHPGNVNDEDFAQAVTNKIVNLMEKL